MAGSGAARLLAPRRVVSILLVAAVAATLAAGLTLRRAQQYTVQTTVFVGRILPATGADVDSSIADFETVIRLPQVIAAVVKQTGVSTANVTSGVSFQRVGASSAVQVSFHASSAASAANVVITASHQALVTLAQQQVDGATEGVNAAQAAATSAQTAVTALDQRLGVVNLQDDYQSQQQDLFNLENQLASAGPGQSSGLTNLISQRTARLNTLGAALPEFQQLSDNLTQATSTLNTANQTLTDAKGKLNAASSPTIVTTPNVIKQSRVGLLARVVSATTVAVLLLGLGLFAITDWMRTRARAPATTQPPETPPVPTPPPADSSPEAAESDASPAPTEPAPSPAGTVPSPAANTTRAGKRPSGPRFPGRTALGDRNGGTGGTPAIPRRRQEEPPR
jgi:hypothetical protein